MSSVSYDIWYLELLALGGNNLNECWKWTLPRMAQLLHYHRTSYALCCGLYVAEICQYTYAVEPRWAVGLKAHIDCGHTEAGWEFRYQKNVLKLKVYRLDKKKVRKANLQIKKRKSRLFHIGQHILPAHLLSKSCTSLTRLRVILVPCPTLHNTANIKVCWIKALYVDINLRERIAQPCLTHKWPPNDWSLGF